MKKYNPVISLLVFLIIIFAGIYLLFFANRKSELPKKEKSNSAVMLEKINNFSIDRVDKILKKAELLRKYGNIPVNEGQSGRPNPFVPF